MGKIIKMDQRGRVLLPQKYRDFHLFDLSDEGGKIVLTPMTPQPAQNVDFDHQIQSFLERELLPALAQILEQKNKYDILAAVLLNSHQSKSRLSSSQIEIALFMKEYPALNKRIQIQNNLKEQLEPFLQKLRDNQINDELSFSFLLSDISEMQIPQPVYLEAAEKGVLIWERKKFWKKWTKKVLGKREST